MQAFFPGGELRWIEPLSIPHVPPPDGEQRNTMYRRAHTHAHARTHTHTPAREHSHTLPDGVNTYLQLLQLLLGLSA